MGFCSDNPSVAEQASDVADEKPFDISFKRIMLAVCAWQASEDLNSFSSGQGGSPTFGAPLGRARFGDLQLTIEEEAAIVAYMKTLTDEYTPKAPKPYKK